MEPTNEEAPWSARKLQCCLEERAGMEKTENEPWRMLPARDHALGSPPMGCSTGQWCPSRQMEFAAYLLLDRNPCPSVPSFCSQGSIFEVFLLTMQNTHYCQETARQVTPESPSSLGTPLTCTSSCDQTPESWVSRPLGSTMAAASPPGSSLCPQL